MHKIAELLSFHGVEGAVSEEVVGSRAHVQYGPISEIDLNAHETTAAHQPLAYHLATYARLRVCVGVFVCVFLCVQGSGLVAGCFVRGCRRVCGRRCERDCVQRRSCG
jgi:hypothetical protein